MMARVWNCPSVHKGRVKKTKKKNIEKQIEILGSLLAPKELQEFNTSEVMQAWQLAIKNLLYTTLISIAETYILRCNLGEPKQVP